MPPSTANQIAQGVIGISLNLQQLNRQFQYMHAMSVLQMQAAGLKAGNKFSHGFAHSARSGLRSSMNNIGNSIGNTLSAALNSAMVNAFGMAGWSLHIQAEMEQAEVVMQTLLGSMKEGTKLFREIKSMAIETPFDFQQLRDAGRLLAIKMPRQDVMKNLRMLGDVASGTGTDLYELAFAYEKVYGNERVLNYSLRQFERRGIPIYQMIADNIGTTQQGVFDLAKKGEISFTNVARAFRDMTSEGGTFFQATLAKSMTLGGQWEKLKDSWREAGRQIGESLQPMAEVLIQSGIASLPALTEKLVSFFDKITDDRILKWLEDFAKIVGSLMDMMEQAFYTFTEGQAGLASAAYEVAKFNEEHSWMSPGSGVSKDEYATRRKMEAYAVASQFPQHYKVNKSGHLVPIPRPEPNKWAKALEGMAQSARGPALEYRKKRSDFEEKKRRDEERRANDGKWNAMGDIKKLWENRPQIFDRMAGSLGNGLFQGLGTVLMKGLAPGLDLDALKKKDEKNILEGGFSSFEDLNRNIQNTLLKDTEAKKTAKNTAKANDWLEGISAKMGKVVANTGVFSVFGP